MLELVDRTDVPVFAGATYPLINTQAASRLWETMYGHWGYKGAWTESWPTDNTVARIAPHAPDVVPTLPERQPHTSPALVTAAEFLLRSIHEHPHQVSLLALGPVTNLALAIRLDDTFAALTRDLTFMGGGFNPLWMPPDEFTAQIADSPRMAFNIRVDPEAAAIVLHAPFSHITAVSEDATYGFASLPRCSPPWVRLIRPPPIHCSVRLYRFPMWDDIAAALLLDPTRPPAPGPWPWMSTWTGEPITVQPSPGPRKNSRTSANPPSPPSLRWTLPGCVASSCASSPPLRKLIDSRADGYR